MVWFYPGLSQVVYVVDFSARWATNIKHEKMCKTENNIILVKI
jgi:hypothetical protein